MANTLPDLDLVPDPYPDLTRPNTLPDLDLLPDLLPWYRRKPCRPISKSQALRAHNQDEDEDGLQLLEQTKEVTAQNKQKTKQIIIRIGDHY